MKRYEAPRPEPSPQCRPILAFKQVDTTKSIGLGVR